MAMDTAGGLNARVAAQKVVKLTGFCYDVIRIVLTTRVCGFNNSGINVNDSNVMF